IEFSIPYMMLLTYNQIIEVLLDKYGQQGGYKHTYAMFYVNMFYLSIDHTCHIVTLLSISNLYPF
ncbi:MAG: hypothetical protein Q8830_03185, partial [Candidatus Phytoplasma australasiaticum]|nr:hypothetical protein [Candidatus Phytoplasma australasiaticum]